MFVLILFLLGLSFGYAAGWPRGLFAFVVPGLLALAATDRSASAVTVGLVVTAAGLLVGFALAAREREPNTA